MLPLDEAEGKSVISPFATGCLGSFWAGVMQKQGLGNKSHRSPLVVLKRKKYGFPLIFEESTVHVHAQICVPCMGSEGAKTS